MTGVQTCALPISYDAEFDVDANNYWSGNVIFNSFKTNAKVAGAAVVTMDGGFEGNGELLRNYAA